MSKHYILGASGIVGGELYSTLKKQKKEVIGTFFKNKLYDELEYFDITKDSIVDKYSIIKNDIVYLLSSQINPNFVFNNPIDSHMLNVISIKRIIDELILIGTKIIFLSTELVFDGLEGGYKEKDKTNPTTLYGKQKVEIESYIRLKSNNFLILRIGAVVPWEFKVNCIVNKTYDTLIATNPQIIKNNLLTITDVKDVVEVINILNKLKIKNDIFHISSHHSVYRTKIADIIIKNSTNNNLQKYKVVDMESINYSEIRPLYSWLNNDKIITLIDYYFNSSENIIKHKTKLIDSWYKNE